jgi:hypothetical protein
VATQSQFRKHLKTRHNKTMDIMGNLIDWSSSSQQDMADMGSNRGD